MTGRRLVPLLLVCACTAPRVVLSRHDLERTRRADVFTDGRAQWVGVDPERFDAIGDLLVTREHLAYTAQRGAQAFVVCDGRAFGPYDTVEGLVLSNGRVAFAALRDGAWAAVLDGRASRSFEAVRALRFSGDGAHFAFVGSDSACAHIVLDGVEGPCRERVLALSVDEGGRAAAVVREDRRERFLFQPATGQTEPAADAIAELQVFGAHHAYAARHGARWAAVVDGAASAECARIRHLRFGDHGRRAAWVCAEAESAAMVVDGALGPQWPSVSAPVLRPDSSSYAYVAHDPAGAWVVTEDSSWGPFGEVTDLALGPRSVTFVARSNGASTLVHREHRIELPAVVDGSLALSDDGEHWALISADPSTRTFWLTVDGARVRAVAGEDVFGGTPLGPWVRRAARGEP